jgi:hypothetical protein
MQRLELTGDGGKVEVGHHLVREEVGDGLKIGQIFDSKYAQRVSKSSTEASTEIAPAAEPETGTIMHRASGKTW